MGSIGRVSALVAILGVLGSGCVGGSTAYVVCNFSLTGPHAESQRLAIRATQGSEEQTWESDGGVKARLRHSGHQVHLTMTTPPGTVTDHTFDVPRDAADADFGPAVETTTTDVGENASLTYGCGIWPTQDSNYGVEE